MRERSNPNYLKFGKDEMILQFAHDRGELRTNDYGEYFLRETMDGRFTCASPELERRLLDAGYTANQRVGITKATHNRSVIWKVRLIDPPVVMNAPRVTEAAAPVPATPPAPRPAIARPAPIPESKYASAAPPAAWPEVEAEATPPDTRAAPSATPQPATRAALDRLCEDMEECLLKAVDMMCRSQKRAVEQGCAINFLGSDVQDLASTIYIQVGKQANINLMNRNNDLRRANGGGDAWRH
jgi:hypothetical protein